MQVQAPAEQLQTGHTGAQFSDEAHEALGGSAKLLLDGLGMEHPGCAHGASRDDGVGLLMSIIHRLDRMSNKHALDTARKALNRMLIVTEPPAKVESLINWSVLFADTRPTEAISRLAQAVELGHAVDSKYLGMVSTLQINAGRYQDAVVTLEAAIAHEGTPDDNDNAAVGRVLELRMKLAETLIDTMDPFNIDASCASLVQVSRHEIVAIWVPLFSRRQ